MYIMKDFHKKAEVIKIVFKDATDYKLFLHTLEIHLEDYSLLAHSPYIALSQIIKLIKKRYNEDFIYLYNDEIDIVLQALLETLRLNTKKHEVKAKREDLLNRFHLSLKFLEEGQ